MQRFFKAALSPRIITFRLTFTGLMLALVLLFQFLEQYMPFGNFGFVKFNLSLAFILITLSVAKFGFATLLLVLRFVLGPLLSGQGYSPFSVIGQVALLVAGLVAISAYALLSLVKSWQAKPLLVNHLIKASLATLITALILTLLNALLFTPWYFASVNGFAPPLSPAAMNETYSSVRWAYFFIPNYWAGQIAVYLLFNTLNLAINLTMHYLMLTVTRHYTPVSTY